MPCQNIQPLAQNYSRIAAPHPAVTDVFGIGKILAIMALRDLGFKLGLLAYDQEPPNPQRHTFPSYTYLQRRSTLALFQLILDAPFYACMMEAPLRDASSKKPPRFRSRTLRLLGVKNGPSLRCSSRETIAKDDDERTRLKHPTDAGSTDTSLNPTPPPGW